MVLTAAESHGSDEVDTAIGDILYLHVFHRQKRMAGFQPIQRGFDNSIDFRDGAAAHPHGYPQNQWMCGYSAPSPDH
jgi:hypothetical protein